MSCELTPRRRSASVRMSILRRLPAAGPGRRRWTVTAARSRSTRAPRRPALPAARLAARRVALDACFTYSIGFRARAGAELGAAFSTGCTSAVCRCFYRTRASRRHRAGAHTRADGSASLARARAHPLTSRDVAGFLGEYLSLPRRSWYSAARAPAAPGGRHGSSGPQEQLLYSGRRFFINGEIVTVPERAAAALRRLAMSAARAATSWCARGSRHSCPIGSAAATCQCIEENEPVMDEATYERFDNSAGFNAAWSGCRPAGAQLRIFDPTARRCA